MKDNILFKIKDSVDIFLSNEKYLMVYYINNRKRKSFAINNELIELLKNIDGKSTVIDIKSKMKTINVDNQEVDEILNMLLKNRIITEIMNANNVLTKEDIIKYDRQINYFSEFLENELDAYKAQKQIMKKTISVFGCGAIGGNIAIELCMAGVSSFILYDYDKVSKEDISRHMYYDIDYIGLNKVSALKNRLKKINPNVKVNTINEYFSPLSDIELLIIDSDFVINTLDEPYIGYTSSKISRICMKYKKPHYIAGGFDAHLASTGEQIIPYVTPCVECYADYFKVKLKDWKPKPHPVKYRYKEIGGLASMSLFSSSYACIEIIKTLANLTNITQSYKIRGEFLFNNLSLIYLNVERNPNCSICGGNNES